MTGSNTTPLEPRGGGGLSSRLGGATSGPSLLNPGAVVPLGAEINERKRPAERESRFDVKESREERRKKRKSRWTDESSKTFIPGLPTMIPAGMTKDQEEAYLLQL